MIDIDDIRRAFGYIKGAPVATDDHSKDAEFIRALNELESCRSRIAVLEGYARDARRTAAWTGED